MKTGMDRESTEGKGKTGNVWETEAGGGDEEGEEERGSRRII